MDTRGQFANIAYRLSLELSTSHVDFEISRGTKVWSLDADFSPKSIRIELSDNTKMEGTYDLQNKHFQADLKLSAPSYNLDAGASVNCDFDIPNKMGLNVEADYNGQDMIQVALEFEMSQTARFNARLHCPPLGLSTQNLGN